MLAAVQGPSLGFPFVMLFGEPVGKGLSYDDVPLWLIYGFFMPYQHPRLYSWRTQILSDDQ